MQLFFAVTGAQGSLAVVMGTAPSLLVFSLVQVCKLSARRTLGGASLYDAWPSACGSLLCYKGRGSICFSVERECVALWLRQQLGMCSVCHAGSHELHASGTLD